MKLPLRRTGDWILDANDLPIARTDDPLSAITKDDAEFIVRACNMFAVEIDVSYEIWQEDVIVAASSNYHDAEHYAAQYEGDGPIEMRQAITFRKPMLRLTAEEFAKLPDPQGTAQ